MAKGNMLLGYSRGSVGDVTFYRSGGSQRARARNRKPANPRTEAQVLQRASFADAVKFFKQCNSSFFKFAYEDKRTGESDYNAYMRHNIKRGELISRTANNTVGYPALGNWETSDGSLHGFVYDTSVTPETNFAFDMGVQMLADDPASVTTVGQLSQIMIAHSPNIWRAGDIVTVLVYMTTLAEGQTAPDVTPEAPYDTQIHHFQFILDTADITSLASIKGAKGWSIVISTDTSVTENFIVTPPAGAMTNIVGVAAIQSRNVAGGLLVSNSELIWNLAGAEAVLRTRAAEYVSALLTDWQAADLAVLQGATAGGGLQNPFRNASTVGYELYAASNSSEDVQELQVTGDQSVFEFSNANAKYLSYLSKDISFKTEEETRAAWNLIALNPSNNYSDVNCKVYANGEEITFGPGIAFASLIVEDKTIKFNFSPERAKFPYLNSNIRFVFGDYYEFEVIVNAVYQVTYVEVEPGELVQVPALIEVEQGTSRRISVNIKAKTTLTQDVFVYDPWNIGGVTLTHYSGSDYKIDVLINDDDEAEFPFALKCLGQTVINFVEQ